MKHTNSKHGKGAKIMRKATITVGEGLGATEYIFTPWEKGDKKRVYVSYRGKRSVGYLDMADGSNHVEKNEFAQEAVKKYMEMA